MIDPEHVPPVDAEETLARFILQSSWIRRSDQTVKPDAFIPHPHRDLSVTRHREATIAEIWSVGEQVAAACRKTLYGRADIETETCRRQGLAVVADQIPDNPNHANISGWPDLKAAQKAKALELAASATYICQDA